MYLLSIFENSFSQGLSYGIAVLGIVISFRILNYPDLTADGSFMLGAVVFGTVFNQTDSILISLGLAFAVGGLTGFVTASIHTYFSVNKILSGLLTTMICYSVSFWILKNSPTIGINQLHMNHFLFLIVLAIILIALFYILLESDYGIIFRAFGKNESLVLENGINTKMIRIIGLMISNSLIAFSGAILTMRQGFADVNMGTGIIIILLASLILGEEILRFLSFKPDRQILIRIVSSFFGSFIYYFFYIVVIRASILGRLPIKINPTDIKAISAIIIIIVFILKKTRLKTYEEELPL